MVTTNQKKILKSYTKNGIIKGGELLLSQEFIIAFIDELSSNGVQINGCDIWRYADSTKNPARIIEFVGGGVLVHDIDPLANTIEEYAKIVKEYVQYRLPKDTDLISLIFEDIEIYDFLREIGDA